MLGVLEAWGYLEGWGLSPAGELLARLNTEGDLVLAEVAARGAARRARPARRSPRSCRASRSSGAGPTATSRCRRAAGRASRSRRRAASIEQRLARPATSPSATSGCPRPAGPIPGFTAAIHAWATGDDLADVLEDEEMTGGDFVRNVKQTIDLLRQVADVAPDPDDRGHGPRRGRRLPARA